MRFAYLQPPGHHRLMKMTMRVMRMEQVIMSIFLFLAHLNVSYFRRVSKIRSTLLKTRGLEPNSK